MHHQRQGPAKSARRKGKSHKDSRLPLSSGPLEKLLITKAADLTPYREQWRALADEAPMQSPEWMLTWLHHFTTSKDELCALLFHNRHGALVGLAPLYFQRKQGRTTVRLLGSGKACTNHTSWLAVPGLERQIGEEVAQFLFDYRAEWDCIFLESIDNDDLAVNTTVSGLKEQGCFLRKSPLPHCWNIDLPETWEEYLMILSRKHRKQIRRLERKFFKSGQVQLQKVRSEEDLDKGFDILLRLHGARWGEPTKPKGVFSDRKFRDFHEKIASKLLRQKQLRLVWLEHNKKPIAAEYQFVDSNAIYAYQAGMEPEVGNLKPGNLSIMASIRYAIEQGCRTFDLLRGNESYKAHYRATPKACNDFLIWPDSLKGRMEYTMWYSRYYARIAHYLANRWIKGVAGIE